MRSNFEQSQNVDESVRDPSRGVEYVGGLTDFLIEEYHRKYGIYSNDDKELIKFWRNHIKTKPTGIAPQKSLAKKSKISNGFEQDCMDLLGMTPDQLGLEQDAKRPSFEPNFESTIPERPGEGFGAKYRKAGQKRDQAVKQLAEKFKYEANMSHVQFSNLYECDVINTIERDIDARATLKKQKTLASREALSKKEETERRKRQRAKIDTMIDLYFDSQAKPSKGQKQKSPSKTRSKSAKGKSVSP